LQQFSGNPARSAFLRGLNKASVATILATLEQRLPEIEALRVARADGIVIFGKGINTQAPVS